MQKPNSTFPDIDLRYLRTFLALAQVGSFSETGRRIGLSQPAVSRHVRAVEDALGLQLVDRRGRRAVLTPAGQILRERLATLMREAESLPRVIGDLADGVQGDVRIGATITAANAILPALLGEYRRTYPNVRLALQPGSSASALESLGRGDIDLALIGSATIPTQASLVAEIPDQVLLVVAPEHPLAGRRVTAAALNGCDFIRREPASDVRALAATWFESEGVKPRNIMDVW